MGYLPEPYTDFILAVIAEELGLVGTFVVLSLLFFLIMRFYLIGIRSKNTYHTLIAYGIATDDAGANRFQRWCCDWGFASYRGDAAVYQLRRFEYDRAVNGDRHYVKYQLS